MNTEIKVFFGLLIVVLLTLSSRADAGDTLKNNNHHLWLLYNKENAPIAQMSIAYDLEKSRNMCNMLVYALTRSTSKDVTKAQYFCVGNAEHLEMYATSISRLFKNDK